MPHVIHLVGCPV